MAVTDSNFLLRWIIGKENVIPAPHLFSEPAARLKKYNTLPNKAADLHEHRVQNMPYTDILFTSEYYHFCVTAVCLGELALAPSLLGPVDDDSSISSGNHVRSLK